MIRRLHARGSLFLILCAALAALAALPGAHAADPEAPMLTPGPGWTGPTPQPDPIGTGFGADAKAIARWDVVPYQTIDCCFEVGVVAFHINGIDRVEFSAENGPWVAVREMTLNPRTQVVEYWAVVDGNAFPDGPIEIRAIAYPKVGIPRVLAGASNSAEAKIGQHSLFLFTNSGGTLKSPSVYVSSMGADTNSGTIALPKATIFGALSVVADGGQVIIKDAGVYPITGSYLPSGAPGSMNTRWITIRPAEGLSREDITITQPTRSIIRLFVNRLRWANVTLDYSNIIQYYNNPNQPVWFDNVKWFDSNGWAQEYTNHMPPVRDERSGGVYVTNSSAEQMKNGFVNCAFVRNSDIRYISGDALQNSQFIVNCSVGTMRTIVAAYHKDVLQMWGGHENTIAYGLRTADLEGTQGLFLGVGSGWTRDDQPCFLDCAFVDIVIRPNTTGAVESSQFDGAFKHVVLKNLDFGGQKLFLRTDFVASNPSSHYPFSAVDVVFEGCTFYIPLPSTSGVTVR